MSYVTKSASTGKNKNVAAKTPPLVNMQPARVDPSEIGKLYNRSPEELLNLQKLTEDKIDQNLFSNASGYRGVLPREPTPFSYVYVRPPKDDEMSGYQAPAPNAMGQKPSALVEVPILKKLPYNVGSYQ